MCFNKKTAGGDFSTGLVLGKSTKSYSGFYFKIMTQLKVNVAVISKLLHFSKYLNEGKKAGK